MTRKKDPSEIKYPGRAHPDNNFHTVEQPGLSMSCYLQGEEVETIIEFLQSHSTLPTDEAIRKQARDWFHAMMDARKKEFFHLLQTESKTP